MHEITKTISAYADGKFKDFRLMKLDAFSWATLLRMLSGLPDLLASGPAAAASVINQTSNSSVPAAVSINVTAAGSDPEKVGKSIYDVAERYLLRTLQVL